MTARAPLCLAYHGVARVRLRDDPYRLFTDPDALRSHIARLRQWGYTLVTFGELARRVSSGDGAGLASLTFDDGLEDNHSALLPILQREGVPATVFVISGKLGRQHDDAPDHRMLTTDQVRELHDAGIEIGAHTANHTDLVAVDYDTALREWTTSKQDLESIVGESVTTAAYPFGRINESAEQACKDAGLEAACLTSGEGSWDDPWRLPRQNMINGASRVGLWLKRDGRFEPLVRSLPGRAVRGVYHRVQTRFR
jgi:peptidoglycan/xylan/chitin deacetylase (PgdA/CDA1 family)